MQNNRLLPICRFGSQQRFLVLCRDSRFCVTIGLGLGRVFLGHDMGFPDRYRVVFILVFYRDKGPACFATMFILYRDNVTTEVPLS